MRVSTIGINLKFGGGRKERKAEVKKLEAF